MRRLPPRKSLASSWDISVDELLSLFEFIKRLKKNMFLQFENTLNGKKCAIISHRERVNKEFSAVFSFLGIQVKEIPLFHDNIVSTLESLKREDIEILILETNKNCCAKYVEEYTQIPLVNAGEGTTENPLVAIRDLFTIYEKTKSLKNLRIGFLGNIKDSGIFRSLLFILMKTNCYTGVFTHPLFYSPAFNYLGVKYFLEKEAFLKIKWDYIFFLGHSLNEMLLKDKSLKYEYERYFTLEPGQAPGFFIWHNDIENFYTHSEFVIAKELENNTFFCNLAVLVWLARK
ncbi:MAG: hypothetical protein ACK4NF_02845 [Planctomycetota bacterium]